MDCGSRRKNAAREELFGVCTYIATNVDEATEGCTLHVCAIKLPGMNRSGWGGGALLCYPWSEEHTGQWDAKKCPTNADYSIHTYVCRLLCRVFAVLKGVRPALCDGPSRHMREYYLRCLVESLLTDRLKEAAETNSVTATTTTTAPSIPSNNHSNSDMPGELSFVSFLSFSFVFCQIPSPILLFVKLMCFLSRTCRLRIEYYGCSRQFALTYAPESSLEQMSIHGEIGEHTKKYKLCYLSLHRGDNCRPRSANGRSSRAD